jgi:hypothetical protein
MFEAVEAERARTEPTGEGLNQDDLNEVMLSEPRVLLLHERLEGLDRHRGASKLVAWACTRKCSLERRQSLSRCLGRRPGFSARLNSGREVWSVRVSLLQVRLGHELPFDRRRGRHAVCRLELLIRVLVRRVLGLHRLVKRAVDHLWRSDDALEAAEEEVERAEGHLEAAAVHLELFVELLGARRRARLQHLDAEYELLNEAVEERRLAQMLRDLLLRELLDVLERGVIGHVER